MVRYREVHPQPDDDVAVTLGLQQIPRNVAIVLQEADGVLGERAQHVQVLLNPVVVIGNHEHDLAVVLVDGVVERQEHLAQVVVGAVERG